MDFSFIKDEMMLNIHDNIDHALVLWRKDINVERMLSISGLARQESLDELVDKQYTIEGVKLYLMEEVPTAENMAMHFFNLLQGPIRAHSNGRAHIAQMDVYETPNCLARYPAVPYHVHSYGIPQLEVRIGGPLPLAYLTDGPR